MKAIFLLILSSVMFVGVGEAKDTLPGLGGQSEAKDTLPIAKTTEAQEETQPICDQSNYIDYIYRDTIDESEPIKCDVSWLLIHYTDLRHANFKFADLSFSDFLYVDLSQADLRYTNLNNTMFKFVDFSFADLRWAFFGNTFFYMADFTSTLVTSEQADYLIEQGISGFIVKDF